MRLTFYLFAVLLFFASCSKTEVKPKDTHTYPYVTWIKSGIPNAENTISQYPIIHFNIEVAEIMDDNIDGLMAGRGEVCSASQSGFVRNSFIDTLKIPMYTYGYYTWTVIHFRVSYVDNTYGDYTFVAFQ